MKRLLACFFLLISVNLNAQSPQWINYSKDHVISKIAFEGNDVWLATYGGLIKLDGITQTKIVYNGTNSGITNNNLYDLYIDNNGNKWIGSAGSILKFDNVNWTNYSFPPNGDTLGALKIKESLSNIYMWGQSMQLPGSKIYKFNGTFFEHVPHPNLNSPIKDFDVDDFGNIWITTNYAISKFDGINWVTFDTSNTFPSGISSGLVVVDHNNDVWLNLFNVNNNNGYIYKYDGISWNLIANGTNLSASWGYVDNNNHVWLYGYDMGGVIECYGNNVQFNPLTNLPSINMTAFAIDTAGNYWAGFGKYGSLLYVLDNNYWNPINTEIFDISSIHLKAVAIDNAGNKWIGGINGLCKFDGYTFTTFNPNNSGINSDYLWSVYIDNSGNIWTVSPDNNSNTPPLAKFDGNTWITYSLSGFQYPPDAYKIVEDNNGKIYTATSQGLAVFDGFAWTYYTSLNSPISNDGLLDIDIDASGNIWMASYGAGLLKFDGNNWMVYNSQNSGLPQDYCISVFCDKLGNVYVSTNYGMTKFDGVNWITYTAQNSGLPFPPWGMAQDKNGIIYGAVTGGFFSFDGTNFTYYSGYNSGVCGSIFEIAVDNGNNKWLASIGGGLIVYNENGVDFNAVYNIPESKFSGNIYHDIDGSGTKDSLEYSLNSQKVFILPDSITTFTNHLGNYFYLGNPGSYVCELKPYNNWIVSSDSLAYNIQLDSIDLNGFDFGIDNLTIVNQMELNLSSYIPRCHSTTNYYITYRNTGSNIVSGTVQCIIDTSATYVMSYPGTPVISNNVYTWNFNDLKPFEVRQIIIQLELPGTDSLGDSLHTVGNILINQMVATSDSLDQELLCSYDPNDKSVEPAGIGPFHLTLKNDTLEYLLRFQNTGNDTAFNVMLIDTLSDYLNISTLDFVSSSHPCNVTCTANGILKFHFENILLPPSETDDPNSNGYVHFKIKPFSGLPDSTVVTNRTFIYFDFNLPIETNTVFNTLVDSILTNLNEIYTKYNNFLIYPNPTNKSIKIEHNGNGKVIFKISDIYGRILKEGYIANRSEVDVSEIRNGLYFLNLYDGSKTNIVWKFIKN